MEIKIQVSENCEICKEGLKFFKELNKRHPDYYANMNIKNYELIEPILLIPDYNCMGYLTHFHIAKGSEDNLSGMVKSLSEMKKCSKEIKKIKRKIK